MSGTSCSAGCDLYAKAGTATVGATALPGLELHGRGRHGHRRQPRPRRHQGRHASRSRCTTRLSVPVALADPRARRASRPTTRASRPNATKAYTFTASRAGHLRLPGGPHHDERRQRPRPSRGGHGSRRRSRRPAGGGAGPGPRGVALPASAFDDEAVLVLSEIDPVFAANPMTADLRAFYADLPPHQRHRVAGDHADRHGAPGHKVLLRYVNAGVTSASMGVLGVKQSLVAQNAYPSTGQALVADTIAAGDTEDALVTIPAGGGNFPVVDSTGRLDTAGQVDGSANRQLAFGGRMTMLSTTGGVGGSTDPGGDTVGPNTTNIAFSPNPAPANTDVTLSATFTDPKVTVGTATATARTPCTAAEYSFDPAVAAGGRDRVHTVTAGATTGTATGSVVIPAVGADGQERCRQGLRPGEGRPGQLGRDGVRDAQHPERRAQGDRSQRHAEPRPTGRPTSPCRPRVTTPRSAPPSASMSWAPTGGSCPVADCSMTLTTTGSVVAATATVPASYVQSLPNGAASFTVTATDALGLSGHRRRLAHRRRTGPGGQRRERRRGHAQQRHARQRRRPDDAEGLRHLQRRRARRLEDRRRGGLLQPHDGPVSDADNGTGFVFVANDGAFDSPTEPAYGLVPLTELTAVPDGPCRSTSTPRTPPATGEPPRRSRCRWTGRSPPCPASPPPSRRGARGTGPAPVHPGQPGHQPDQRRRRGVLPRHGGPGGGQRHRHSRADVPGRPGDGHGDAAEPASRRPDGQRPGQGPGGQLEHAGVGERHGAHGADLQ